MKIKMLLCIVILLIAVFIIGREIFNKQQEKIVLNNKMQFENQIESKFKKYIRNGEYNYNNNEIDIHLNDNFDFMIPKQQYKTIQNIKRYTYEKKKSTFKDLKHYKFLDNITFINMKKKAVYINFMSGTKNTNYYYSYSLDNGELNITDSYGTWTYNKYGNVIRTGGENEENEEMYQDSEKCYNGTRDNSLARYNCLNSYREKWSIEQ